MLYILSEHLGSTKLEMLLSSLPENERLAVMLVAIDGRTVLDETIKMCDNFHSERLVTNVLYKLLPPSDIEHILMHVLTHHPSYNIQKTIFKFRQENLDIIRFKLGLSRRTALGSFAAMIFGKSVAGSIDWEDVLMKAQQQPAGPVAKALIELTLEDIQSLKSNRVRRLDNRLSSE